MAAVSGLIHSDVGHKFFYYVYLVFCYDKPLPSYILQNKMSRVNAGSVNILQRVLWCLHHTYVLITA